VAIVARPEDHGPVVGVLSLPDVNTEVISFSVVDVVSCSGDVSESHVSLAVPSSQDEVVASCDSSGIVVGQDEVGVVGESD